MSYATRNSKLSYCLFKGLVFDEFEYIIVKLITNHAYIGDAKRAVM